MLPLVELVNVTKRFGKITALNRINLSVEDGEYLCILGPTGAGKTTLLRLIAGLLEPDEGEIYIEGRKVNKVPPEERNAAYMFQNYALFPHMNVWRNVSFGPIIKEWDQKRINDVTSEILEKRIKNEPIDVNAILSKYQKKLEKFDKIKARIKMTVLSNVFRLIER